MYLERGKTQNVIGIEDSIRTQKAGWGKEESISPTFYHKGERASKVLNQFSTFAKLLLKHWQNLGNLRAF